MSSELATKEADTWQKLLRVLTHEISNSAIPLSTLSAYIYEMVTAAEADNRKLTAEERQDVLESLKAIDQRSKSLKQFIENFGSVNRIPEPELKKISIRELMEEVSKLFCKALQQENITMQVHLPSDPVFIYADKNLTMQVLINLVKNPLSRCLISGKVKELYYPLRMVVAMSTCMCATADVEFQKLSSSKSLFLYQEGRIGHWVKYFATNYAETARRYFGAVTGREG